MSFNRISIWFHTLVLIHCNCTGIWYDTSSLCMKKLVLLPRWIPPPPSQPLGVPLPGQPFPPEQRKLGSSVAPPQAVRPTARGNVTKVRGQCLVNGVRKGCLLFATTSRPTLGPTHAHRGTIPPGVRRPGREAHHSLPPSAIHPLPHECSCRGA
jgi:hypothetical protein